MGKVVFIADRADWSLVPVILTIGSYFGFFMTAEFLIWPIEKD